MTLRTWNTVSCQSGKLQLAFTEYICVATCCLCLRILKNVFANVVHFCSMLQFSSARDHQVFGRPVLLLPILTSHTDVACAYLRWYIIATLPPPPPIST